LWGQPIQLIQVASKQQHANFLPRFIFLTKSQVFNGIRAFPMTNPLEINSGPPPARPPDISVPIIFVPNETPKTQVSATTAGKESNSESTAVSNPKLGFEESLGRRLSSTFQTMSDDEWNNCFKNVKFTKGTLNRPRSNSISEVTTLESMRKNQGKIVNVVNSMSQGLGNWFTDQEGRMTFLKEQVTDLTGQLKQANTNQESQILSLKEQLTVLTGQLEKTNNTLKHLVTSKVSLSDTTGLQEDVQAMKDDIKKAVHQEAERNIRCFRTVGDKIVSTVKQMKGDVQTSSPEYKKRKVPFNDRLKAATSESESTKEVMEVTQEQQKASDLIIIQEQMSVQTRPDNSKGQKTAQENQNTESTRGQTLFVEGLRPGKDPRQSRVQNNQNTTQGPQTTHTTQQNPQGQPPVFKC
jgi:hypothetical protein